MVFFLKLYHASTINVTICENGSSEPCDHASTVTMSSDIPEEKTQKYNTIFHNLTF